MRSSIPFHVGVVLILSLAGYSLSIECPEGQYPYGGCSSCFSLVEQASDFDSAIQNCQQLGGQLLTIEDASQLDILGFYLEGLRETRQLWVGYRYHSDGSRIDLEGQVAPAVIGDNGSFVGTTSGNQQTCVGVRGFSLLSLPCAQSLSSICMFTYGVPEVSISPDSRILYVSPLQLNFDLAATVRTPEAMSITAQWRFNNTIIAQDENGFVISAQNGQAPNERTFSLVIPEFNSSLHVGTYELLVQSLAGVAVSATWQLREPVLGQITIQPQNLTLPLGKIAAFECKTENALPSSAVTWFKDSIPLDVAADTRLYVSDVTGTLFIRDIVLDDAGLYHCVCENGAGSISSRSARLVIAAISGDQGASHFFINPRPLTILAGQPFNLECVGVQTHDISSTLYTLFFDQHFLNTEPDSEFVYPRDAGFPVYRIESVTVNDTTSCTSCVISPEIFQSFGDLLESTKVPLTVHSLARVDRLTTSIQNGIESDFSLVQVPSGSDITIQCQFSGVPIPNKVEWTRNGALVDVGVVTEGNVSTLSLIGVNTHDVYQCHVENVYGRDTASVYLCSIEEEFTLGAVPFIAVPDSNSSIFISWDTPLPPLPTHPLLLRYEITIIEIETNTATTHNARPGDNQFIAPGLYPSSLYNVYVVARSLIRGELGERLIELDVLVRTFSDPPTEPISTLTVQRTLDNSALVVQWTSQVLTNVTAPILPVYEVQYKMTGDNDSTLTAVIEGDVGSLFTIEGLDNAASYEVRIRLLTQVRRDPLEYARGPWSEFIEVAGITTLPPPTGSQPDTPPTGEVVSMMGLLLIYILVPVGVVLLIVICVCLLMVCWCCKRRKDMHRKYSPSKHESMKTVKPTETTQRPMGNQVFDLPLSNCASQVWVENGGFAPRFTPQPTAMDIATPPPTIVQGMPDKFTTFVPNRDTPSATPTCNFTSATPPQSHNPSTTVTVTYLPPVRNGSGTSSPDLTGSTSSREKNGQSLNKNGASANATDNMNVSQSSISSFGHQALTPLASSMYSLQGATPSSLRDPFGYSYKEATPGTSVSYSLGASVESNLGESKSHRLSDCYDSLEPDEKEDLGEDIIVSTSFCTPDIDFQILEELAKESAAMASERGTPDPYAPSPSSDQ